MLRRYIVSRVRPAHRWHGSVAVPASDLTWAPDTEEPPPDAGSQCAAPYNRPLQGPRAAHHPLSATFVLPFGLLPAALVSTGGTRCFSSSPDVDLSEFPSSEVIQEAASATAAAVAGGSEVAAIADQSWPPIAAIQYLLEALHQTTGLPWWATIAATTLVARASLTPVTLYQMRQTARMSAARPELEMWAAKLKENPADPQAVQRYQEGMKAVWKKHKINPFATMAGAFAQAPLFIGFFLAIRRMSENLPSFKEGGILWFTDLSGADPTYILPTICAATFLITVEVGALEGMQGQPMAHTMKNLMRVLAVAMVPLTMSFEKALFCYWIPSNLFSLLQSTVLKSPKMKARLGIPILKAEGQPPLPAALEVKQPEVASPQLSSPSEPRLKRKKRVKKRRA